MSILLVSENFPPRVGGSGRWFWEVYQRLETIPAVIAAGEHPQQAEFDRTHELAVIRTPLTLREWGIRSWEGLSGYWRSIRSLRQIIRHRDITQVHCGRCLPEGWMAWVLKKVYGLPYVSYIHGEDLNSAALSREQAWIVRRVLSGAAFLIANSRNTAELLRRDWQVAESRIRVLYPGVDTNHFVPAPASRAVRETLGWDRRTVVLTVGRLQRRKGHDQLIRAIPQVLPHVPDLLYAIAGDGEERARLVQLTREVGVERHVQFLGEVDEQTLLRCYQQCDLFVLPNRQDGEDIEGFGMVLIEAQACGRPVVAGASGGTSETMRIPETGRVVPCEGPDQLAALLRELLPDRERLNRMGTAGRQWVVENFDWTVLCKQARGLFEELSPARVRLSAEPVLTPSG